MHSKNQSGLKTNISTKQEASTQDAGAGGGAKISAVSTKK